MLAVFTAKSQCNELFISEYMEGSSNNKAIEIYNPTSMNIPLSGLYQIRIYSNGATTPSFTINLTGTIMAGDVYVLAHTSSIAPILAVADQTTGSLQHNGNDAIELYRSATSTSIDVVGIIGNDPGTGWTVSGTTNGTQNHNIIRLATVQQPNLTWTGSAENEWTVLAQDDISNLGMHTMNACGPVALNGDFTFADHCLGTTAVFNAFAVGGDGNYTYAWDFGDGSPSVLGATQSHTYATAGTYTVTMTVVDGTMTTEVTTHGVIVHPNPVACINPTGGNGCAPDTVTFTNCSSGNGPLNYQWIFSNGNVSTAFEPVEIFTNDTNWVELTVIDNNGCSTTMRDTGYINMPDDASFNYSASTYCINDANPSPTISGLPGGTFAGPVGCNPVSGVLDLITMGPGTHTITYTTNGPCSSTSVVNITINNQFDATIDPAGPFCELGVPTNLTATDGGGTWSGNGIIDANSGTFDASAAGVGMHTIAYTISGSCGDTDTEQFEVLANETVNIYNNDTTICNDIFGFFLSAEAGGVWSGNLVSDNTNGSGFFSAAAIAPGTYYAVYEISGQCGDIDSIQIDVYDYPVADFTYSGGITVNFTDASSNADTWSWDFDDNGATSVSQNPTYTFTANGNYDVCLTVTNSIGCESIYCETITITGVGINEKSTLNFSVFPNPSQGNFTLQSNTTILRVTVKDLIGKNILTKNINSLNAQISLNEVNNGFYFIEIETTNGKAVKRVEVVR